MFSNLELSKFGFSANGALNSQIEFANLLPIACITSKYSVLNKKTLLNANKQP